MHRLNYYRWRMGNIQAWGGPLPQSYLQTKLDLLKKIVSRMRSLGMTPVLPVFSGNVPKGITRVFPNAHVVHHSSWNNFNATYSRYAVWSTCCKVRMYGWCNIYEVFITVRTCCNQLILCFWKLAAGL